ncbi:MAG: TldD/PmbA family protein [Aquificaceae bacterium]|nr:TldD/PmbA family protein [Aquificaceae bacterium]MCX8163848.1 TldD/PmbA family protein [Aquificaceae bacterium]
MVKDMLKEKSGFLLSNLLSQGGEYGEIFYERVRLCRMHLEDNKIDKVQWGLEEGVGIRLIKEGKTYYGYTTEPSYENLMEIVRTLARGHGYGPVKVGQRHIKGWTNLLIDPDEKDINYRTQFLHRANETARSYGDKVKQVMVVLMDRSREILIINSLGEMAEDVQKRVVFFVDVTAQEDGLMQRGYESVGIRGGFELFERISPEEVARKATERALLMLKARPAPAGSFTVVLASQAGGTMIHEAVGHGLEADLVQKGLSVYRGKLGQKVASELITVIDDATYESHNGSFSVDDEGVPSQKTILIEKGYLVGYMYDRLTAMREGRSSTGNGRRQSYAHVPMVRMTNTYIASGKENPEDIIADTKKGVLVVKMGGGEVNTVTGDFVFEVMEGYMIEDGRITYPIRSATLIGNGPKALQDVDAVGSDLGWSIGTCGKEGQGVPVTDAQPTLRIRSMVLGGTDV